MKEGWNVKELRIDNAIEVKKKYYEMNRKFSN
jgi:hypothetical protein